MFLFKRAYLFFVRIIFGELSGAYFDANTRFKKRYPDYHGNIKTCFREEILFHFDKMLERSANYHETLTEEHIMFYSLPFSSSKAKVIEKMGKPDCMKFEKHSNGRWQVLGYNETEFGLPLRTYFFFVNGKLFFGEYIFNPEIKSTSVKRFGEVIQKQKVEEQCSEFTSALIRRYASLYDPGIKTGYITDKAGSVIFYFNSGESVTVRYMCTFVSGLEEALGRLLKGLNRKKTKDKSFDSLADRL
ncbi:MAG: hypothetical protein WCI48_04270 [Bacteroidota bacterium]|jgi:hypothetical protein